MCDAGAAGAVLAKPLRKRSKKKAATDAEAPAADTVAGGGAREAGGDQGAPSGAQAADPGEALGLLVGLHPVGG